MKKLNKNSLAALLAMSLVVSLFSAPSTTFAADDPDLADAASFSIIAQTAITGTGTISGDVGMNSTGAAITDLTAEDVGGTIYSTDGVAPGLEILESQIQPNLSSANDNITAQGSTATLLPVLDGVTLTTGVYDIGAGRLNGGVLTLDGPGIFIFRTSSDFVSSGSIDLINGARACDVYWQVKTLATINGSEFTGTIIAGTGIHFGANVALDGRALALGGDVTLINNTISGPTCEAPPAPALPAYLFVVKNVVNDNGGTAVASDFTINVAGTNVTPSSFAGSEEGVWVELDAGAYSVTETGPTGYLQASSVGCSGTMAEDENRVCTITNNDIAPQLIVNKVIVNDDDGTKVTADFSLFVDGGSVTSGVAIATTIGAHTVSETADAGYTTVIGGDCAVDGTITLALGDVKTCTVINNDIASAVTPPTSGGGSGSYYYPPVPPLIDVVKVPNPLALPAGPGSVTYTYTLRNIGTVSVTDVTMVGDTCDPIVLISGDTNGDTKLDVNETWTYTCTTTLATTHTNTITATGWANGISAVDIASATVVVSVPIVPPLIHVTKVPNPLTLLASGGMVTYTKTVTNPGTVALSNVRLTDDKCGPINYVSGDTNSDSKLDPTEAWTYTCQTNLTQTTTNTAVATGEANGLTARDFAIATVVVAAPGFPDAGLPADHNWVLYVSILALLAIGWTSLILWPDEPRA